MEATDPRFWSELCDRFQREHADVYRSWFLELTPADMQAGRVRITSADPARIHYLRDRCSQAFASVASSLAGRFVTFSFDVDGAPERRAADRRDHEPGGFPLDADYTFDEFVVGAANRLAHAACHAAVSDPGAIYNPLFIHGPSGLGKSHLMQATCTEMVRRRPETVLVYVTCEKFVNEFVSALAANRMDEFRHVYRNADLLAIDDVHVLAGRESSQDEFFHTFNALYQGRKQILLSADVSPVEIPTLEERLVSRFNWGLVAPIGPPDQETRRAILKRKAQLRGYRVPDELLDLIAESVESNVRVLEGVLNRVVMQAQLLGEPPTREMVSVTLEEFGARPARQLQIGDILEMVSTYYGIRRADLLGKRRTRSIVQPRHVGMYLARKLTSLSLEEIGGHFGGRDHSTVLHAERAVEDLLKSEDRATEQALVILTRRLLSKG